MAIESETKEFETKNWGNALRLGAGRKVAEILSSSWRFEPSLVHFDSVALAAVAPLLTGSGAAGLGWWRIGQTEMRESAAGGELKENYRMQILQASLSERKIQEVFQKLQDAGIEALLLKGWACARLYPQKGLRPLGDIDIYVRPQHLSVAAVALDIPVNASVIGHEIDLKSSLPCCYDLTIEALFARSQVVSLGETNIRIPSPEDHLRVLCIHFMRHGAWRPLWLCDIAVALENRPSDFDWRVCIGANRRTAEVIIAAIGLAQRILGADLEGVPVKYKSQPVPRWLLAEVWKQWNAPRIVDHAPSELIAKSLRKSLRNPLVLMRALKNRWPNPIETLVTMRVPLSVSSPLPWQCVWYTKLCWYFLSRAFTFKGRSENV